MNNFDKDYSPRCMSRGDESLLGVNLQFNAMQFSNYDVDRQRIGFETASIQKDSDGFRSSQPKRRDFTWRRK